MGCIVCLLVDWPITGGEEWGLICGERGGGAISGRLWYVILVALEGIILIVIL